ncbi:C40 family peptidase, partial [Streptomyces bacillaris]|uniref:C40 family peptidase n=1 Tax=Streptomyces bacillaris TaxID=68179 RepID=UPI0036DF2ED0
VTAGLCGAAPIPATAQPAPAVVRLPAQALTVSATVEAAPIGRDEAAATSQAQLDAARAARAAAAAQKAVVEAAAAHTAALAAVGRGTGSVAFAPPRSGAAIVAYAEQYVGVVSYSTGASPAAGFECDGLTQWVYGAFGVHLPRVVTAQEGTGVQILRQDAQAGDLVVYSGEHIGIYDGAGGIIDSPDWGRKVSHRRIWGSPIFIRIP